MARPCLGVLSFSLITGLLLVAYLGGLFPAWRAMLLAGHALDSTPQKVRGV